MNAKIPPGFVLVPEGFEWTGECRLPRDGEYFMDHDGVWTARRDFQNNSWPILVATRPMPGAILHAQS